MCIAFMRMHMELNTVNSAAPVEMIFDSAQPRPSALSPAESQFAASQKMRLKPTKIVARVGSLLSKRLKSIFDRDCPVGYEDETGFNYGEQ